MPDWHDSLQVKLIAWGKLAQIIHSARHIEKGAGPRAALIANAPVLDIPRRVTPTGEVLRQPIHQREIIARAPVATMNKRNNWMWPGAIGQVQFSELQVFRAIGEPQWFDG